MTDILERLKATTKVNGAYPKDIEDAIARIEWLETENKDLRGARDILNKALKTTSEGNVKLLEEVEQLRTVLKEQYAENQKLWERV